MISHSRIIILSQIINTTHAPVITEDTWHTELEHLGQVADQHEYTRSLQALEACRAGTSVALPEEAIEITTPLILSAWEQALEAHPDREWVKYLLGGIAQGFHIGFNGRSHQSKGAQKNMLSALQNPKPVDDYLRVELAAGRIVQIDPGHPATKLITINRFGVIPKKGQPGRWRLITDLSYPPHKSVNDGISRELCAMHYVSVDTAVKHVVQEPE